MTLEKDDFRTIIEDARTRHAAVVNLIYFIDRQAMTLMRVYLMFGIAAASGAAASFAPNAVIPRPVGWALIAATICMVAGIYYCLRTMSAAAINLPGRKADFWLWAIGEGITKERVLKEYLDDLVKQIAKNDAVNDKTAESHTIAKAFAFLAPIAALAAGLIATYSPRLF